MLIFVFCFVFFFYYIAVMSTGLVCGIPRESPPFDDAEIPIYVTVCEEKTTGKNGGHFDGTIYKVSELTDEELKEVITSVESNSHWKKGALSDELKDELTHVDAIDSDNPMFDIDNGYHFFKDRHDEASGDIYKFDREVVISSRYSTNYIISALDIENKTLYYFQLDT